MIYKNIVAIAIGAASGTILRYSLNIYTLFVGYPIGTIIENILGSLLIGFLTGWFINRNNRKPREWVKLGLGVGFCGGFTTMSTFAADFMFLFANKSLSEASIYILISLFGGLLYGFIGLLLGLKWSEDKFKRRTGGLS